MARLRMTEEQKMIAQSKRSGEILTASTRIPYSLINAEVQGSAQGVLAELTEIATYYNIYKNGMKFSVEGSNGSYQPAMLNFKIASSLIDKEARFLFAEAPDMVVKPKGDVGEVSQESLDNITSLNDLIKTILDRNKFEDGLLKGAKDCFIGKRVAILVNFNEEDGITVTFIPSMQFIYENKVGDPSVLSKFVCFMVVRDSRSQKDKLIFKKKYILDGDSVMLEEALYDGAGTLIEELTPLQPVLLTKIPAVVVLNDGLTGDMDGESEIAQLSEIEGWFSKLSNADIDSMRKGMNPITYSIDIDPNSTKNFKGGPGAYWDAQSDQNIDNAKPTIGRIEAGGSHGESLKLTLDRIKQSAYDQVDMPNVDLDAMRGTITSGKSLKAIYWPLIVRCKEKMKTWAPALRDLVSIIVDGSLVYESIASQYTDDTLIPVAYEVHIDVNHPLPEDEVEEKNMDLSEVEAGTMSRKAYMMKWRMLTDDEANLELEQIELEKQMVNSMHIPSSFTPASFDSEVEEL